MLQQLKPSGQVDLLTSKEVERLMGDLKDWMAESVRGARPIRFVATGLIAGNAVTVSGDTPSNRLGPEAGFYWMVRRIAVTGLTLATDPTSIYINAAAADHLVYPNLTGLAASTGYKSFTRDECMLVPNDRLVIASTGAVAATGTVVVSGAAVELPASLLWRKI